MLAGIARGGGFGRAVTGLGAGIALCETHSGRHLAERLMPRTRITLRQTGTGRGTARFGRALREPVGAALALG
ncbi:Uncharacterised protein [Mycobacteroides abscessus subsp. abscessus]|nr:Uncharacterised protein [Mycobacteroides abscessus subsp. abscessus]